MAKLPTPQEHARLWAGMGFKERRAIVRAVNRGEAMTSRKDAKLAVGTARQQQRYWRWAWLVGPASGLIFIPNWTVVVVNGLLLGLMMGALAYWRYHRAQQAEQANLAVVSGKKNARPTDAQAAPSRRRWPWQRGGSGDR